MPPYDPSQQAIAAGPAGAMAPQTGALPAPPSTAPGPYGGGTTPGGGLAAQGFRPRPPVAAPPPAGVPGGGMAAAGAVPPRPPMAGGPSALNMQRPTAAPAGNFGMPTKAPVMTGQAPIR